jgi:hypothetical protein
VLQGQLGISFVPGDDLLLRDHGRFLALFFTAEFGEILGYAENNFDKQSVTASCNQ